MINGGIIVKSIKKARTQRLAGTQRINSLSEGWALARENVMRIDLCKHDLMSVIDSLDEQIIKCSYDNVKATAKDLSDYADDLAELAHNIKSASIGIRDFVDTTMDRRNPKVRTEVYDDEFDPDGWEEDEGTARNTMRAPKKRSQRYEDEYEDEYSDDGYEDEEPDEGYDVEITSSDIDADLEDMPSYRKPQEPVQKQEPKQRRRPQPEYSEVIPTDEADDTEEQEPEESPRKQRPKRRQRTSQTK